MPAWKKKNKDLDWEGMFRKYVWNVDTTPYFTAVPDLNRRQANSEVRFYCWFVIILFGVITLTSFKVGIEKGSVGVAYYGLTVVCAAVLFGIAKFYPAALYLSATPLVSLTYLWLYGMGSERPLGDTIIVTLVLLALLRYSLRLVAIAKAYPEMSEAPSDDT
tara:strand:+ start:941 stop:1426 length:486 start_codon:yes stop_codon:yes gene_type:complete